MSLAEVNGTEIYYEVHGDGEPVVLIPGLGQGTNYYAYAIEHLAEFSKVVALELRGVGRSARPSGSYSMETWADDVAALLDHLGEPPAHIVGSSLGGCVAMALVDRYPNKVASLALVAAFSELDRSLETNFRLRSAMIEKLGIGEELLDHITMWTLGRRFLETENGWAAAEALKEGLRLNDPEIYVAFLRAILDFGRVLSGQEGQQKYTEKLAAVDVPTLLVVGEEDILTPRFFSERILEAMPRGVAELKTIPNCGHVTFVERPAETSRLIVDFVRQILQGQAASDTKVPSA